MQQLSTLERLRSDLLIARREQDSVRRTFLSTLLSAVVSVGKDQGNRETTQQEAENVIKKFLKNVQEFLKLLPISVEQCTRSRLLLEEHWLLSYLPKQLSREELVGEVKTLLPLAKGEIMKTLKQRFGNSFDSKLASTLIDEYNVKI